MRLPWILGHPVGPCVGARPDGRSNLAVFMAPPGPTPLIRAFWRTQYQSKHRRHLASSRVSAKSPRAAKGTPGYPPPPTAWKASRTPSGRASSPGPPDAEAEGQGGDPQLRAPDGQRHGLKRCRQPTCTEDVPMAARNQHQRDWNSAHSRPCPGRDPGQSNI